MDVAVNAALWVVSKALAPVTDGLLESWAASAGLGPNIGTLRMQLLYAQGMLDNVQGRDIRSAALKELLHKLQQLAYVADDVLDELEYFRIQDALDGTYHAADVHAQGCVDALVLNARHTVRAVANKLNPASRSRDASGRDPDNQEDDGKKGCLSIACSGGRREITSSLASPTNQGVQEVDGGCMHKVAACARGAAHTIGKRFPCYSFPLVNADDAPTTLFESSNLTESGKRFLCHSWSSKGRQRNHVVRTPRLKFDRVEMSKRMLDIVEELKPLCAMVSTILDKELLGSAILTLELLGSSLIPTQNLISNRPKTNPAIIEPKLYGRDTLKKNIVDGITHGKYCADKLIVLPIVGPGGIGKTTLLQHIYQELESSFQVSVWVCVSLDFNSNRLAQEIVKKIPKVSGEKENASDEELIVQRLKSKRLLLVLDDMWRYHEYEWKTLLAPLRYSGGEKGNIIIVTTRIPEVASKVSTTNSSIELERLSHDDVMSFFEACVFGDQQPWKDHLDELHDIGRQIVSKLKGFPLAVKTVGRLLTNKLTLDHWTRVVESREWELQTGVNDIMPALKLSYDYLPFHLQQCFSYCALFPEDYEFGSKELVQLWIGLGILHLNDKNKIIEDVGLCYLDDLVSHGFFKENKKVDGSYYVIHDLMHELAVNVSSYECLSINSSNVRSVQIRPSIRHLSIIVDNTDVKDTMTFEEFKSDLNALSNRLKVQNLRTLMLFGVYHGNFVKTFRDLFMEAVALRTILFSEASYSVEGMLLNFSKLVHLRYLRITSVFNKDMCLPSALFTSYHLEVIDLEKWKGSFLSTRHVSNLVKLRHFLVPRDNLELHSNIFEVGKLKFLKELIRFDVGKEPKGFEPSQLGELKELGGLLGIYNLEKLRSKGEFKELILIHKNRLHKLILEWDNKDTPQEENVLESLVPHKNLRDLFIRGHGGANCPSWLGGNLSVSNLESLCLYDVSWNKLPPLGDLWFVDGLGEECQGLVSSQSFQTLKVLELVKVPKLKKWVGNGTCHLFSLLEVVIIKECPELMELPFSHVTCCEANREENMNWFPKLRELKINDCPKLSSLPTIPWTPAPCSIDIAQAGSGFETLRYFRNDKANSELFIIGKDGGDSMFWNGLSFHNLADLKTLTMVGCPPLPLIHLQKLRSLKTLTINSMSNAFLQFEVENHKIGLPLPVERIELWRCDVSGSELTLVLSHFPRLKELDISCCEKITGFGLVEHQTGTASGASSPSANKMEQTRGDEELAAGGEGLLLLPPQLQELSIYKCPNLRLLDNDNSGGGGFQSLYSLRELTIRGSNILSFPSSCCFPFHASLQELFLESVGGIETFALFSNLVSLTNLFVRKCGNLRGEGLWPLLVQGRLTTICIFKTPKFFTGSKPSCPHDGDRCSCSSKLRHLVTDDLAGVLTPPICRFVSSSLTRLHFNGIGECFTEEQEKALHLLTSLQELEFWSSDKLRHLPAGLNKLTNLKRLVIRMCPAIDSLPKGGLPRCLRELDIGGDSNKGLKRQCRKLKGTIPIIQDYYY